MVTKNCDLYVVCSFSCSLKLQAHLRDFHADRLLRGRSGKCGAAFGSSACVQACLIFPRGPLE